MKQYINVYDYSKQILNAMQKGILLTTKDNNKYNSMILSWAMIGNIWNKDVFIICVRENRHTKKLLDNNKEFSINIPLEEYSNIIYSICGEQSGADINKFDKLDLTTLDCEEIDCIAIKEFALTLECKVIYKQKLDENEVSREFKEIYYPQDVSSTYSGKNKDYHTLYYGEILTSYIIDN